MEFKVGMEVYFKTWEEMKEEFGLTESGRGINCEFVFTEEMEEKIDKSISYEIIHIDEQGLVYLAPNVGYNISIDMLKSTGGIPVKSITKVNINDNELIFKSIKIRHFMISGKYFNNFLAIIKTLAAATFLNEGYCLGLNEQNYNNPPQSVINHFCDTNSIIILMWNDDDFDENFSRWKEWAAVKDIDGNFYYSCGDEECFQLYFFVKRTEVYNDKWVSFALNAIIRTFEFKVPKEMEDAISDLNPERISDIGNKLIVEYKNKYLDKQKSKLIDFLRDNNYEAYLTKLKHDAQKADENLTRLKNECEIAMNVLEEAEKKFIYAKYGPKEDIGNNFIDLVKSDFSNITKIVFEEGGAVVLYITQPLLFFSDEDWEIIRESYLNERLQNSNLRMLVDAIFTRKYRILFETPVIFDFHRNLIWSRSTREPNIEGYSCGIPNPHIKGYNCWGNNEIPIKEAVRNFKYDIAYSQVKSALAGLNVNDTPVLNLFVHFLELFKYTNISCIEDSETGEMLTIEEAINNLGGQEQ